MGPQVLTLKCLRKIHSILFFSILFHGPFVLESNSMFCSLTDTENEHKHKTLEVFLHLKKNHQKKKKKKNSTSFIQLTRNLLRPGTWWWKEHSPLFLYHLHDYKHRIRQIMPFNLNYVDPSNRKGLSLPTVHNVLVLPNQQDLKLSLTLCIIH